MSDLPIKTMATIKSPAPDAERTEGSLHLDGSAAASKPPKPHYTGNWRRCCDRCKHAEPHYCRLYARPMKNMDCKTCRSWQEWQNAPAHRPGDNNQKL